MISYQKLRKEKEGLREKRTLCLGYLQILENRRSELDRSLGSGKITGKEYRELLRCGLSGRSYEQYREYYGNVIEHIDRRTRSIENKLRHQGEIISVSLIAIILVSFFILYNSGITGNVTYSLIESNSDKLNVEIHGNQSFMWKPKESGRLNTISITGKYVGNSGIAIFFYKGSERRLIYAAENSAEFEGVCGNACYIHDPPDEFNISVEMQGNGTLMIEKIDYMISELSQFDISPSNITINITDDRYIKGKVSVYNSRKANMTVMAYLEGDLAQYTTLGTSLIHFSEDEEKKDINYEIDLPLNMDEGSLAGKVIIRYLPQGSFKGEAPKEEHNILIHLLKANALEKPSGKRSRLWLIFAIAILVTAANACVFLLMKKKK